MNKEYVIGVDVGTGSVRASLIDKNGEIYKTSSFTIRTWNPKPDYFNQSSDNIWLACGAAVKDLVKNVNLESIKGIGFDATCSLVVLDINGKPLSVYDGDHHEENVILWMDHRAKEETDIINRTKHRLLKYIGGKISLEMVLPKLLWIKKNLIKSWKNAGSFLLLPDFMTWKATGSEHRSLCSLVCKWTYEADEEEERGWDIELFNMIGLDELAQDNWSKIGNSTLKPGDVCGLLTETAAQNLGLLAGIPVATSIIDAHAGGIAIMGCGNKEFDTKMGLICGTSTCHMAVCREKIFVPGVWGPYYSAMVPDMWLLEGGQSISGKLIEYIIKSHPAGFTNAPSSIINMSNTLNDVLEKMAMEKGLSTVDELTKEVHVWPDFHGNRSPVADPTLRGMISGISLEAGEEDLAVLYLATIQALAYGTRYILDTIRDAGHERIRSVIMCGGLSNNKQFRQTYANAIGLSILLPNNSQPVLLGASMLAATAAQFYPNLNDAMIAMAGETTEIKTMQQTVKYHNRKYAIFLQMLEDQRKYKRIMLE